MILYGLSSRAALCHRIILSLIAMLTINANSRMACSISQPFNVHGPVYIVQKLQKTGGGGIGGLIDDFKSLIGSMFFQM